MAVPLSEWITALEAIAPLDLAASWDNVGLLIEPALAPGHSIERALLAIDFTPLVLAEAQETEAQVVVAYHPPIFAPLRRLTQRDPREQLVAATIVAGIAIYSPHTALDAVPGGVNDWLADGLGPGTRRVIEPASLEGLPAASGQGRLVELDAPVSLDELAGRVKRHLGLARVRIARAARHRSGEPLRTIALCPGAGGSVVAGATADVALTGEMRHHDVLASLLLGRSVLLTEHSHSERGYLPRLRERLLEQLPPGVEVVVSGSDREPLESI